MAPTGFWDAERLAPWLMIGAIVPLAVGVGLFIGRGGLLGGAPRSPALLALERGSIIAAAILTVLGFVLLESEFPAARGGSLARIGVTTFLIGAVLLAVAEAMSVANGGHLPYPLVVVYVVLALVGQAAFGGALLQSGLLPAWIGWTAVAWNVGFLVALPLFTPQDIYYPILHHIIPALIAVALLLRA